MPALPPPPLLVPVDRTGRPSGGPCRSSPPLRTDRPRLLVVRLSAIGDVLHALPAVEALRRARPRARIEWLVEDRAASALAGVSAIDALRVLPRARWRKAGRVPGRWPALGLEIAGFVRALASARYDAVLDLQGNLKSGLLSALTGAPVRYGLATGAAREGNPFFTNRHVRPAARHRVERNLELVSALLGEPAGFAPTAWAPRPDEAAWADRALAAAGLPPAGYAVLHPGTSGFGAFKRWPPEAFASLADRIRGETGVAVALTFGPGEEGLVEAVRSRGASRPVALATPSLTALAEVLRRARVFVSADTGPLHLAAAVGTPVLGLFGPKDERTYGPYGNLGGGAAGPLPVLSRPDVPCRPCTLRWCPEPVCMTTIPPAEVFASIEGALRAAAPSPSPRPVPPR